MNPIIIDVEASGFGKGSYPIEVGLALSDGSRHCYLIAPARNWTAWDDEAEEVHGIRRETLTTYGRPLQDVAWRLNELLRNKTVYTAWGWGEQFIYIIPKLDSVVVFSSDTSGGPDDVRDCDYDWFIKEFVIPAHPDNGR